MHNKEHPVRLYHRLVRQLHHPQGSPEGGAVCPTHHRGHTTCPPGHLQHLTSNEGQNIIKDKHHPSQGLFNPLTPRRPSLATYHPDTQPLNCRGCYPMHIDMESLVTLIMFTYCFTHFMCIQYQSKVCTHLLISLYYYLFNYFLHCRIIVKTSKL
jgi:hypothetical protein